MNHDASTCVAGKCRKNKALLFRLVDQCSDKQNNSEYRAVPEIKSCQTPRNIFIFFAGQHLFRGSLLSLTVILSNTTDKSQQYRVLFNNDGTLRRVQTGPCSEPRGYHQQGPAPLGPPSPPSTRCPTPHLFPPSAHRLNPDNPTDRRKETFSKGTVL